jgi:hypothetical protein
VSNDRNSHGLSRAIPESVTRLVRQRCGFGCVVCGNAIVQYHHFNPPFRDAQSHNTSGITLLCGSCHDKEVRGLLTQETIKKANDKPAAKQRGYAKDVFYIGDKLVAVKLAGNSVRAEKIIVHDDEVLLGFKQPEAQGGPFRLNAKLYDVLGNQLLEVRDNEWHAGVGHYDVVTQASRLTIKGKSGETLLVLSSESEKEVAIREIEMMYEGFKLGMKNDVLKIEGPGKSGGVFSGCTISAGAGVAIYLESPDKTSLGLSEEAYRRARMVAKTRHR